MVMTFPASTAEFIEELPIQSITFDAPETAEMSQTAGGEILTADVGARLWRGQIALGRMDVDEANGVMALIDVFRGAGRSFYIHNVRSPFPQMDRTGSILGGAQPEISALPATGREIALEGLPAGYVLKRGDRLSFDYGSEPIRTALHRIVDREVVANGAGQTAPFEVVPRLRDGAALGSAVRLIKPYCKAILVPGSVEPGTPRRGLTEGVSFAFIQTLR
ncbi:hypothetical protein [Thalassococcus sp. S3]|uniref:hypothetical protein n=1 Tax=Thalassococcus sp. S3 TaxID=2017482 RepID=UPI0010246A7E|nr:hypothetical protein [Thalassococcus sp. S3]QBF31490.1 hypothetical protein CFI11_09710 [Thalassococcus sp. S3]